MRGDEHGCADLRRSLTAHTKPVRSLTYDPPRTPGPDAWTTEVGGCARDVSVALVAGAPPPSASAPLPALPAARRHPAPARLRRPDSARSPCRPTMAGTA